MIKNDDALANKIKLNEWIYQPGIPSNIIVPISKDFNTIDSIQANWRKTGIKGLSHIIKSTNEKQYFIDHLPEDITTKEMTDLDAEFHFSDKGNFVVKRQWFVIAIKHQYQPAYPAIEAFLIATSRTGSLQTLYKEMVKTPQGKVWAKSIFEKAKSVYHKTTVQDLQTIVN